MGHGSRPSRAFKFLPIYVLYVVVPHAQAVQCCKVPCGGLAMEEGVSYSHRTFTCVYRQVHDLKATVILLVMGLGGDGRARGEGHGGPEADVWKHCSVACVEFLNMSNSMFCTEALFQYTCMIFATWLTPIESGHIRNLSTSTSQGFPCSCL